MKGIFLILKGITLKEPWVSCIFHYNKDLINKNKFTNHIGPLFIHSSKSLNKKEYLNDLDKIYEIFGPIDEEIIPVDYKKVKTIEFVVGIVYMFDCLQNSYSIWSDDNFKYKWLITNPIILHNPFKVKGKQGFLEISEKMLDNLILI